MDAIDRTAVNALYRAAVDALYLVNVEDKENRANRLKLLAGIRAALMPIADFSKIEG